MNENAILDDICQKMRDATETSYPELSIFKNLVDNTDPKGRKVLARFTNGSSVITERLCTQQTTVSFELLLFSDIKNDDGINNDILVDLNGVLGSYRNPSLGVIGTIPTNLTGYVGVSTESGNSTYRITYNFIILTQNGFTNG